MNLPWLPYMVTTFMTGYLCDGMKVFEWGSGDSTRWLALHAGSVVSVEHNPEWYRKVGDIDNVERLLIEPEPGQIQPNKADPHAYYSECLGNVNLRRYASAIDDYGMFSLILVDGRARPSCLMHAASHVSQGGVLVLDNTERPYYLDRTLYLFDRWDRMDVHGHGPRLDYMWKATVFVRGKSAL